MSSPVEFSFSFSFQFTFNLNFTEKHITIYRYHYSNQWLLLLLSTPKRRCVGSIMDVWGVLGSKNKSKEIETQWKWNWNEINTDAGAAAGAPAAAPVFTTVFTVVSAVVAAEAAAGAPAAAPASVSISFQFHCHFILISFWFDFNCSFFYPPRGLKLFLFTRLPQGPSQDLLKPSPGHVKGCAPNAIFTRPSQAIHCLQTNVPGFNSDFDN